VSYASVILADAPVAYWPLEESGTAAGAVYHDATGHGYDVSVVRGTFTHVSGPLVAGGTAPSSPGGTTADGLTTTNTLGLPTNGSAYSLEGWIQPVNDGNWHNWINYGPAAPPFIGSTYFGGSPPLAGLWDPTSPGLQLSANHMNYSGWNYICVTDNAAGTMCLYTNGVLESSQTIGTSNGLVYNASNFLFISDPGLTGIATPRTGAGNQPFVGGISNVAIYNYALSATQVSNHYNARSAVSRTPRRQSYVIT
jgi:hypothetical protein